MFLHCTRRRLPNRRRKDSLIHQKLMWSVPPAYMEIQCLPIPRLRTSQVLLLHLLVALPIHSVSLITHNYTHIQVVQCELSSVLLVNTHWGVWLACTTASIQIIIVLFVFTVFSFLPNGNAPAEQLLAEDPSYYWLYPSKQAIDHFMLFTCLYHVFFSPTWNAQSSKSADPSACTVGAGILLIATSMNNLKSPTNVMTWQPGYKLNCTWRGMVGGVRDWMISMGNTDIYLSFVTQCKQSCQDVNLPSVWSTQYNHLAVPLICMAVVGQMYSASSVIRTSIIQTLIYPNSQKLVNFRTTSRPKGFG